MVASPNKRESRSPRAEETAPKPGNTLRIGLGLAHHPVVLLLGLMLVVGVLTAAVHWPALSAQALSLDDQQFLTDNRLVRNPSWASASRFFAEVLQPSSVRGYYLPLSMISLMLDYAMGGRPDDLRAFHRTSLALHVLNTVLIIALLYSLFGQPVPAALVGLLFGVHPLTVEPVAWVGERKTLLAAFFTLGCLLAYVRYARRGRPRWFAAALLAYVLGLLSKPTAAPLPLLLLILDYWPLRRLTFRTLVEKGPFLAVGVVSAVITVVSHSRTAGILAPSETAAWRFPLVVCHLMVFYLGKLLWPTNLSSVYPFPEPVSLANPPILAGVIGTGVLAVVFWFSRRRTRALLTGGLFFFVAIFPTLGVVQYSWVTASDKYVYLPLLGLLMIVTWASGKVWNPGKFSVPLPKASLMVVVMGLSVLEARGVRRYLVHWEDSLTLAEHLLELAPHEAASHTRMADALGQLGRREEAIGHFREVLRLQPGDPEAHYNLGMALRLQGKLDEAIGYLWTSVQADPKNADAAYTLGLALQSKGRSEEAADCFRRAIAINPDHVHAYAELGRLFARQENFDEAIQQFGRALAIAPDQAEVHYNLALAFQLKGNVGEAVPHYREALRVTPDYAEAHNALGNLLAAKEPIEALTHFRAATRLKPDWAPPLNAAAWILATYPEAAIRDEAEAIRLAERAAGLTGGQEAAVLDTLAAAYASAGRFDRAVTTAQEASALAATAGDVELTATIRARLEHYRQRRPYREP
ncbi:MAG: tetratricopeptide repeat protein [Planctomycetota bacterium]